MILEDNCVYYILVYKLSTVLCLLSSCAFSSVSSSNQHDVPPPLVDFPLLHPSTAPNSFQFFHVFHPSTFFLVDLFFFFLLHMPSSIPFPIPLISWYVQRTLAFFL